MSNLNLNTSLVSSKALVDSSSRAKLGLESNKRANARRCCSPIDRTLDHSYIESSWSGSGPYREVALGEAAFSERILLFPFRSSTVQLKLSAMREVHGCNNCCRKNLNQVSVAAGEEIQNITITQRIQWRFLPSDFTSKINIAVEFLQEIVQIASNIPQDFIP
ncbi:light-independent protochlorophyllide reductase subunit B [Striga asiatica]|uniref:Light-independent protochlorophyllide reductase subunit B n=1 Tax=Striga asiatica TaxID=4170 RepID=A0A5A7PY12_STRAF|nr:light-independent protochlorophyllide reductase subunit B [Striga asiatica]